jgi:hypothetical protein
VKSDEDLYEKGREIEMLKTEVLEQEKMIFRLKLNGMYAFRVCVVG